MSEIYTCVLCGRRGTQRFVMVAADPKRPEDGHRARCQDRKACRRRTDAPRTEQEAPDADPVETEPAMSAAVAGLARQVEQLTGEVLNLRGLRGQVEDITRVTGELASQLETLAARPRKQPTPTWLAMPGEDVEPMLSVLTEWLAVVWLRYPDAARGLPECWAWHPDVVEELLWLRHTWRAAYQDPAAPATAAADWHDRYRPNAVARIKKATGTCSLENHTSPTGPATVPLAGLLQPVTDWWCSDREQPAPAPSQAQFTAAHAWQGGTP